MLSCHPRNSVQFIFKNIDIYRPSLIVFRFLSCFWSYRPEHVWAYEKRSLLTADWTEDIFWGNSKTGGKILTVGEFMYTWNRWFGLLREYRGRDIQVFETNARRKGRASWMKKFRVDSRERPNGRLHTVMSLMRKKKKDNWESCPYMHFGLSLWENEVGKTWRPRY